MGARFSIVVLAPILLAFCLGSYGCGGVREPHGGGETGDAGLFLGETGVSKPDFEPPSSFTLCGEKLPFEWPSVRERFEAEFSLAVNHSAQTRLWQRRAKRFFPVIEATLKSKGLPDDLKYLAVAESDLRPLVFSPAGAAGLWQFIPSTARRYGLKTNKAEDQRLLPELSLLAGIKYLSFLREKFGTWALAMAAYNAGEARIARAIASQPAQAGSSYYQLRLPQETERYVYRIAAIKAVLESADKWGLADRTPVGLYEPLSYKETQVVFKEPETWASLAKRLKRDYRDLRAFNPHLASQETLSGGPYILRIPN